MDKMREEIVNILVDSLTSTEADCPHGCRIDGVSPDGHIVVYGHIDLNGLARAILPLLSSVMQSEELGCPPLRSGKINGSSETRHVAPPAAQAALDVLAERRRQVEAEGWSSEHDDGHFEGDLARAAACYAAGQILYTGTHSYGVGGRVNLLGCARLWPWHDDWWKPKSHRENLVKAGALILAEIERLDRTTASPPSNPPTPGALTAQAEGRSEVTNKLTQEGNGA